MAARPFSLARPARYDSGPTLACVLLVALLVSLQFGPMLGLLGFRATQAVGWTLLSLSRDLLVLALIVLAAVSVLAGRATTPLPASARTALLLVLVFVVLAAVSPADLTALALNLRRQLLVPLLFVALLLLPWTPRQVVLASRLVLASSIAVAAFGLFEYFAPDTLWIEVLPFQAYNSANPLDPFGGYAFHDSGRAFSWDLERWAGRPLRRAMSTYLEPTTLAAGMAAALALALAARARRPRSTGWSALLLVGLCGLLTLAKGYALFLLALGAWRLFGLPSPRQVLLLTLAGAAIAIVAEASGWIDGPFSHLAGLATAVHYLVDGGWLGEGLGLAGNYSAEEFDAGTESGLGNVVVQVGLAAVLPLWWVQRIASDVLATAERRRDPGGPWLAGWLLFWLLSFLFSASSLGVGGNALGFLLLALYLHPAHPGHRA